VPPIRLSGRSCSAVKGGPPHLGCDWCMACTPNQFHNGDSILGRLAQAAAVSVGKVEGERGEQMSEGHLINDRDILAYVHWSEDKGMAMVV